MKHVASREKWKVWKNEKSVHLWCKVSKHFTDCSSARPARFDLYILPLEIYSRTCLRRMGFKTGWSFTRKLPTVVMLWATPQCSSAEQYSYWRGKENHFLTAKGSKSSHSLCVCGILNLGVNLTISNRTYCFSKSEKLPLRPPQQNMKGDIHTLLCKRMRKGALWSH